MLHAIVADDKGSTLLATHPRAVGKGVRIVDEERWDGLPDGKTAESPPATSCLRLATQRPVARVAESGESATGPVEAS
jgi:hypothetical protein